MKNIAIAVAFLTAIVIFFLLTIYVSPYCYGLVMMPGSVFGLAAFHYLGKELGLSKETPDYSNTDWIDTLGQ